MAIDSRPWPPRLPARRRLSLFALILLAAAWMAWIAPGSPVRAAPAAVATPAASHVDPVALRPAGYRRGTPSRAPPA